MRARTAKATVVAAAIALCGLLVATGVAGRMARKAKTAISDARRSLRERRAAERLAAAGIRYEPGPDVRLEVAEPVFGARTGLSPGWMDHGWSPHELAP